MFPNYAVGTHINYKYLVIVIIRRIASKMYFEYWGRNSPEEPEPKHGRIASEYLNMMES